MAKQIIKFKWNGTSCWATPKSNGDYFAEGETVGRITIGFNKYTGDGWLCGIQKYGVPQSKMEFAITAIKAVRRKNKIKRNQICF